jgi:Protein of unknown function (DUF2480)
MIENRISSNSKLVTLDLSELIRQSGLVELDISTWLWQGLVLKEAEFRSSLNEVNWNEFHSKHVLIRCSADAIVPTWAYMLVSSKLTGIAATVLFSNEDELDEKKALLVINELNLDLFENKNVVVKGCSDLSISPDIYVQLQLKLQRVTNRIMFGEPCSTVPIYKK